MNVAIRFDNGLSVDFAEEVCAYGAEYGVLTGKSGGKPGHWYYGQQHLGDTKEQAKVAINEDIELRKELTRLIREQMTGR